MTSSKFEKTEINKNKNIQEKNYLLLRLRKDENVFDPIPVACFLLTPSIFFFC